MKSPLSTLHLDVPRTLVATGCALAMSAPSPAAEIQLAPVTVYGQQDLSGQAAIGREEETTSTSYRISGETLERLAAPSQVNPYRALAELPSVSVGDMDPYGFSNLFSNKGLRVRGKIASHGAMGSVDGLPLTGINPGPGYLWLFDMENIASVSLSQGPIPPDRLAFFTTMGVLDNRLRWPEPEAGVHLSQSLGAYDFTRSFVRLDSGLLENGMSLFGSASYTSGDQWRGPGDSPEGRENFEGGLVQRFDNGAEAKLYFAYNDMSLDSYRSLSYAQSQDLSRYRNYGYKSQPSANPAEAVNYYKYNTQDFTDWTLFGEFTLPLRGETLLTIKPFYAYEEGVFYNGMSNGKVREWLIDHDWYGLSAELETRIQDTDLKVGYWLNTMEPPGPPTAWKLHAPTASGGLSFAKWALLAEPTERHSFQSLYAMGTHDFGDLRVQAGARYLVEHMSGFDVYDTTGIGDLSYDRALKRATRINRNRSTGGTTFRELLPYLGLTYALDPATDINLSIGRNYGAPVYGAWPVFQMNYAKFAAAGVSAADIWDTIEPEISDAIDLGMSLRFPWGSLEPTLYYASYENQGVAFWDPAVGIAYTQNIAESHAYGAQILGTWQAARNLDLFGTLSYDRSVFDKDLVTTGGAKLEVEGKQIPGAPQWHASLGGHWRLGRFGVSPVVHYSGDYYADSARTEEVDDYVTVDLDLSFEERLGPGDYRFTLSFINLFDTDYIGYVNTSYVQDTGGFNYYPGAPFTVLAKVAVDF
ncbi:TonB-dependent receptor [Thiorhodococcus drewsii AZ1]|uniref:TonB-dependent receptor n=1 Tax=Thiorhodococcus drewsii AZ1 TaxID=765913 RepID=G2DY24_9GAMM|nr:TonB-dependent receptor [Thiorhodococcus drewsii]EGV32816.1 TonB-dependent receptor [Thiorhodococcus drewsii AZ1]